MQVIGCHALGILKKSFDRLLRAAKLPSYPLNSKRYCQPDWINELAMASRETFSGLSSFKKEYFINPP